MATAKPEGAMQTISYITDQQTSSRVRAVSSRNRHGHGCGHGGSLNTLEMSRYRCLSLALWISVSNCSVRARRLGDEEWKQKIEPGYPLCCYSLL